MHRPMVEHLAVLYYFGRSAAILAAQCRLEAGATYEKGQPPLAGFHQSPTAV